MKVPARFSTSWWLVIGATTVVVGVVAFALLESATGFSVWQFLIIWAVITVTGDVIMAIGMEAVAPVRVLAGPGDRRFESDDVRELAVVVSAFDGAQPGTVRVRGEIWSARLATGDAEAPGLGARVRIIDRDGLTLVVSNDAGQQPESVGPGKQRVQRPTPRGATDPERQEACSDGSDRVHRSGD